jgi:hypothetical protein
MPWNIIGNARCHALLAEARDKGRKLKGKDETWFLGHGVGVYEAPGQRPG